MNWIDLNGVFLRYAVSGGSGRTVVMIHEMGGSLESWEEVVQRLPDTVHTLRYDLRGSGMSEKIQGRASIEELVSDVAGLIEATDSDTPVVIAGCAAGAAIALAFAAANPALAAGVVALSPAIGVQTEFRADRLKGLESVEAKGQRSISENMLAMAYPERLRASDPARFESYRARWIAADPYGFAAQSRMLFDLTFDDFLSEIRCPVLAVAGRYDPLRPPDHVEELSRYIPMCRYVVVESGHFMNVQSPELVAGLIQEFMQHNGLS